MKPLLNIIIKYKLPLGFLLGVLLIVFAGQKILATSEGDSQNEGSVVETVKKGNITESIAASGSVATANYLPVTTGVNGLVKTIFVKEGDKVVLGQKIMEVTLDSDGEAALASAYSSYLKAKTSLDDGNNSYYSLENTKLQKEYAYKNNESYDSYNSETAALMQKNDVYKATNDYNAQKQKIAQLQIAQNSAWRDYQSKSPIITSPSDGVVANIVAVEGTQISNSVSEKSVKTVASIKKEGTPIITLNVGELDINNVKVGQKVIVKLNSVSGRDFVGNVAGIDKIGVSSSGVANYPVIVKFDKDEDKALPNMGAQAEIVINEKSGVLYVPTSAIKSTGGKKVVIKSDGQSVEVNIGISDSSNTEIVSGLNEGDKVLISALPTTGFTTTTSQRNVAIPGLGGFGGR